jgi:type II secretory pathway component PulM
MKDIDVDALSKQAEQAAQEIDAKALNEAIAQSRQQFQLNREQIERQMEGLKKSLQSLQIEQMD